MDAKNSEFVLIPKTRNGASYQNKPRVYFTGYPGDIGRYFSEITDDILKSQNCAIYRDPNPDLSRSPEELQSVLEQMQLLVIPVTNAFLERENRARDMELPIAFRLHKPVLFWSRTNLTPQQTKTFNKTCRNLQILIKEDRNPDPIPYEEKLAVSLRRSLVGGRLAERVRTAFGTYLFLSYRKADREFVKTLMKTIHRYSSFWDTAIWYDEFLTIGEDFNAAIQDAMEKSRLTLLLVTPNILEPGNYTKEHEYPQALRLSLPVLPVAAGEVDPEELKQAFEGLPDCVPLEDGDRLAQALRQSLRMPEGPLVVLDGAELPEISKSPEHDYLIGLAYLHGIDVEVNSARGTALLTRAAEQGFEEAIASLAAMYYNGNGVPRNGQAAVLWQEKLANLRRQAYQAGPSLDNGLYLITTLDFLGRYHMDLRHISEAKAVFQEMLEVGTALSAARHTTTAILQSQAISCAMLGDLCFAESNLKEAADYFERCQKLISQYTLSLSGSVPTSLYSYIGVSMERLGTICESQGNLSGAWEYYRRTVESNEALYQSSPSEMTRHNLAAAYEKLGNVSLTEGKLDQAEEYYTRSLSLFQQNLDEFRTQNAEECLAVSLTKMGDLCRTRGDFRRAKDFYQQSLSLFGRVPEQELMAEELLKLLRTYGLFGLSCLRLNQLKEARPPLEHALDLSRKLVRESKTRETLIELSIICNHLGDLCQQEGRLDEAESFYLEDLALSQDLYRQLPNIVNKRNLALSYNRAGELFALSRQDVPRGKTYFLEGLKLSQEAAEELNTPSAWSYLASNYFNLAQISAGAERIGYAEQAYKILDRLLKDDPENPDYFIMRDQILEQLL